MTGQQQDPNDRPTFEDRMESFGREAQAAGEAFGKRAQAAGERFGTEAQAAGERLSRDPAVVGAANAATVMWGLIVLAVGLWFFADITLGLDLPAVSWRDLWPLALILIGLTVLVRGFWRRA
jgi:hypothetical protein